MKEELLQYFDSFKKGFDLFLKSKNINATGKLAKSPEYTIIENSEKIKMTISVLSYVYTIDAGRRPTSKEKKWFSKKLIEEWVIAKRIPTPANLTFNSFVYLIWRKINVFGTKTYRTGGRTIFEEFLKQEAKNVEFLINQLGAENIANRLINAYTKYKT